FIVALLKGDATLATHAPGGVFHGAAPAKMTKYPFVSIQQSAALDVVAANPSVRVMHWGWWVVKAVGPEEKIADVRLASMDIDRLLSVANGSTAAGLVQACFRAQTIFYPETVNAKTFIHSGGIFEVSCEPL